MSIREELLKHLPTPKGRLYGPRGTTMLGLSVVAFTFGLVYAGPAAIEPHGTAMLLLSSVIPLSIFGILWCIVGFHLATSAFKVEQGRAIGGITAMFSVLAITSFVAFGVDIAAGRPGTNLFAAVMYTGMVISLIGQAKMVNPSETHLKVIEAPGPAPENHKEGEEE